MTHTRDHAATAGSAQSWTSTGSPGPTVALSLSATRRSRARSRSGARPRSGSGWTAGRRRGPAAGGRDPHPGRHAADGPPRHLRLRAGRPRRPCAGWRQRARSSGTRSRRRAGPRRPRRRSTPRSIPSTHGVHQFPDRLPASAMTIAEVFRERGLRDALVLLGDLHGPVHEPAPGLRGAARVGVDGGPGRPAGSKTAREFVDRLLGWLDDHRDVPFFVFLHVFDPHPPYEPNRAVRHALGRPEGARRSTRASRRSLKKAVADAFLAQRGMATRDELVKAGIDPAAFIRYSKDWYDGSIRGMDAEIAPPGGAALSELGLGERALIAFYADHGEEFHDHGRMWHGQSVYGEMMPRAADPLGARDACPAGRGRGARGAHRRDAHAARPVRPAGAARRTGPEPASAARPAPGRRVAGRRLEPPARDRREAAHSAGTEFPNAGESYAIVDGGWKLIHNVVAAPGEAGVRALRFLQGPARPEGPGGRPARDRAAARLTRGLEAWQAGPAAARLPRTARRRRA